MLGPVEDITNGVVVHQVTDEPQDKHNIYCEYPWCPPDGHCFAYVRHAPEHAPNQAELVLCDFGTWQKRSLGFCSGVESMAAGRLYYRRINDQGRRELLRLDWATERSEVLELPAGVPDRGRLEVSPDERYVAYNMALSFAPKRFAIGLADRQTGQCGVLHEDPDICNPHQQFEPGAGRRLLIQHNRGCEFTPAGQMTRLVGDEGATLFTLDVPSGAVTRLPLGPPHTVGISGHECWIGTSGEVLATLNTSGDYDHGKGPIVAVRPGGGPAREVCKPWRMNHLGMEPSGRMFCADAFVRDEIIIGVPATNRAAFVCRARTSYKRSAARGAWSDSHPHAYVSPDLRWVVFNSDRSGVQQVYCAALPREMVSLLLAEAKGA